MGNMSQDEIANLMGLSRPKVSRMLKAARDMNIVKFTISTPPSHYLNLAQRIRQHFGLEHVIVVESDMTKELSKQNVSRVAAEYFMSILRDNSVIGLAWGSTISNILKFIPQQQTSNCSVWQLTAGLPSQTLELDGHEITKRLAARLNASWHIINAPFIVQNKLLRDLLIREPEIANHFAAFEKMDIAIVGLGSSDPYSSMTYRGNYITFAESKQLVENGCAADLCGHRITADARPAETFLTGRVIAIELEALKKVPQVIAVASGEDKAVSIVAASRGQYIKTLIIDELAAISVIKRENIL
jgi:DNA-binding transcriptional regulator LsrR (DeoR family)